MKQPSRSTLLIVALVFASACRGAEDPRYTEVRETIQSNQGATITLAEHTTFEWERVHFFGPYTSYSTIRNSTGYDPPINLEQEYVEGDNPFVSEGSCVIVFTNGNQLVAGYLHPRGEFDSSKLSDMSFSKEHAVFFIAPCESPGGPRLELPSGR